VSNLMQRQIELAGAKGDPEKRLEALGGLAGDLAAETRALARVSSAGEMDDMAEWFQKVVEGGIVPRAKELGGRTLTPAEKAARVKLLDGLAARLSDTARDVGGLVPESPEGARPALKRIVESARSGQSELRSELRKLAEGM